jgi:hypothetical protein
MALSPQPTHTHNTFAFHEATPGRGTHKDAMASLPAAWPGDPHTKKPKTRDFNQYRLSITQESRKFVFSGALTLGAPQPLYFRDGGP